MLRIARFLKAVLSLVEENLPRAATWMDHCTNQWRLTIGSAVFPHHLRQDQIHLS